MTRRPDDAPKRDVTQIRPITSTPRSAATTYEAPPVDVTPPAQPVSAESRPPAPLGYTPFELPSRGMFYGPTAAIPTPPLPGGVIEIRPMKVTEEETLLTGGGNTESKVSKIIAAVTNLPRNFDPGHLLLTDRMFIVLALRRLAYGSKHNVSFRCTECNAHNRVTIDMVQDFSEITPKPDAHEPFHLDLDDAAVQVGLRFRRGIDELAIMRNMRDAENRELPVSKSLESLRRMIVEVNGEKLTGFALEDFLQSITARDSRRIMLCVDEQETGIDMRVYPECRKCQVVNEFVAPFTAEMFRPTEL